MTEENCQQLITALRAYFQAIELQKMADPVERPALRPHFEALDRLTAQLPSDCDPRLRHFMVQKSYQKAIELLNHLPKKSSRPSVSEDK